MNASWSTISSGWGKELQGEAYGHLTELRLFYDALARAGRLDDYFAKAKARVRPDSVIFTGYLTHRELRHVLPCCDVAIFPSTVAEAGPLVFLEAIASGCFPLGTYFAGMGASIDAVGESLPAEDVECMKLSADPKDTVADIAINVPGALALGTKHQTALRRIAVERYDWQDIAAKLAAGAAVSSWSRRGLHLGQVSEPGTNLFGECHAARRW